MALTPTEYAWQQLCDLRSRIPRIQNRRLLDRMHGESWAYAQVLARVSGTSATYEADKIIFKTERAVRKHPLVEN